VFRPLSVGFFFFFPFFIGFFVFHVPAFLLGFFLHPGCALFLVWCFLCCFCFFFFFCGSTMICLFASGAGCKFVFARWGCSWGFGLNNVFCCFFVELTRLICPITRFFVLNSFWFFLFFLFLLEKVTGGPLELFFPVFWPFCVFPFFATVGFLWESSFCFFFPPLVNCFSCFSSFFPFSTCFFFSGFHAVCFFLFFFFFFFLVFCGSGFVFFPPPGFSSSRVILFPTVSSVCFWALVGVRNPSTMFFSLRGNVIFFFYSIWTICSVVLPQKQIRNVPPC